MKSSRILIGVAIIFLAGGTYLYKQNQLTTVRQQITQLQSQNDALKENVARLSYNVASGGGINLKMMSDPDSGQPTVPLAEIFSFDRNHAICRVETNAQAFKMQTYKLGEVTIAPHRFFMSMVATSIDQFEVTTQPNNTRKVVMRGGLDCATEVGQTTTTLGSRTAAEHATYKIEAVDGGIGGGKANDSFAFTVYFDPDKAPINYSIFGPEFTFTGQMTEGEITIIDPHH